MWKKLMWTAQKAREALWARWTLRNCNTAGPLCRVRGKLIVQNEGAIYLGDRVRISGRIVPVELTSLPGGEITIGDNTDINFGASICAQQSVKIGKNCAIGNYSLIMDTDFHTVGAYNKKPDAAPIVIEDDVWLAARVIILKGVTIGRGSVVSAGSVVATNVPPYMLVGGVPARPIRKLENAPESPSAPAPAPVAAVPAVPAVTTGDAAGA